MPVDEDRLTGRNPTNRVGRRQATRSRPAGAAGASALPSRLALVAHLLITECPAEVFERPSVGDPRQKELGPVVGEDRVGRLAVARARLGEVLEDVNGQVKVPTGGHRKSPPSE